MQVHAEMRRREEEQQSGRGALRNFIYRCPPNTIPRSASWRCCLASASRMVATMAAAFMQLRSAFRLRLAHFAKGLRAAPIMVRKSRAHGFRKLVIVRCGRWLRAPCRNCCPS
jgi:hypothetical protein